MTLKSMSPSNRKSVSTNGPFFVMFIAPVIQKLACISPIVNPYLKGVWNYQDEEACKISHQSHSNVNLLFLIVQKHPLSLVFFIGSVILISITVTERRRGAGQRLSLSAHSCPLMCSVWGADNFHRADWVQGLISCSMSLGHTQALVMITDSSCGAWK